MKHLALAALGLGLAACNDIPAAQPEPEATMPDRQVQFIEVVEGSGGCRVHPVDHEWLHLARFSDEELAAYGENLVASGMAQITPDGTLVLLTENCV